MSAEVRLQLLVRDTSNWSLSRISKSCLILTKSCDLSRFSFFKVEKKSSQRHFFQFKKNVYQANVVITVEAATTVAVVRSSGSEFGTDVR